MIVGLLARTKLLDRTPVLIDEGPGRRVRALIIVARLEEQIDCPPRVITCATGAPSLRASSVSAST